METDVIVIGSGIGGLSCAAILARYSFDVVVCESYSTAGGAAHGQVLDAIGEELPCVNYDTWYWCTIAQW